MFFLRLISQRQMRVANVRTGVEFCHRAAKTDPATLVGRINAGLRFEMTGENTKAGLAASWGELVISMANGRVSRTLLRRATVDARQLLHDAPGFASVLCFVGVATMRDGLASVAPLRLKTNEGNLYAYGQIDLRRGTLNLLMRSEGRSTPFWALDIPLHVTGKLDDPKVMPYNGPVAEPEREGAESRYPVSPALQRIARKGC